MVKRYFSKSGSLISYGIAYTFTSGIQKAIGFAIFMYFATYLSINQYAEFGLDYSIFTAISTLTYAGIIESVISLLRSKKEDNLRILFKAANSVFIILSIGSSLIVYILIRVLYFTHFSSWLDIFYLILGAVSFSFFTYQSILVRLEEKHITSIFYSFIPAVTSYIIGLVFVHFFKTGVSFFIGTLLGVLLSFVFILSTVKNNFTGITSSKVHIYEIFSRILPYIIISLLAWILGYGNSFLIKYLFNDFEVGLFVFLFTISSIIQLVASSMNQVWSPRFFSEYETCSVEKLEIKYIKFTDMQGLVVGFTGCLILIMYPIIIKYIPSLNKFSNYKLELFILFIGYIIAIPWWHAQNYFMINNKGKLLMNLTLVSGIIGYGVWGLSMIFWGHLGIFIGFFLQMIIRTIIVFMKGFYLWQLKLDIRGIFFGTLLLITGYLINF